MKVFWFGLAMGLFAGGFGLAAIGEEWRGAVFMIAALFPAMIVLRR